MTSTTIPTQTVFTALMIDYAQYNLWANQTLVAWLKTKTPQQMEEEVPSSFSSIKKTLLHIWQTQHFWQQILQQEKTNLKIAADLPAEVVVEGIVKQSEQMLHSIKALNDETLQEKIAIETPWFSSNQPRYELIQHCFNHSTYHRGQLITIGRNLGITDAPMTDFNFYLLMIKPNVTAL